MPANLTLDRSRSVRQVAAYYAVSPRKVRAMIRRGLLRAIDVGCGRQQLRVTPDALAEFENRVAVKTPVKKKSRRGRDGIDPDVMRALAEN